MVVVAVLVVTQPHFFVPSLAPTTTNGRREETSTDGLWVLFAHNPKDRLFWVSARILRQAANDMPESRVGPCAHKNKPQEKNLHPTMNQWMDGWMDGAISGRQKLCANASGKKRTGLTEANQEKKTEEDETYRAKKNQDGMIGPSGTAEEDHILVSTSGAPIHTLRYLVPLEYYEV